MLYYFYILGIALAGVLPIRACYFIADITAYVYYFFARRDKEEVRANLRVILGEGTDERVVEKHAFLIFRNFAKYLADFFKTPKFTEKYIEQHITVEGRRNIDDALSMGKGAILLSLHLGNWELGGAIAGGLGYPMNAIVLEHKNRKVNEFFVRQRAINGMRSIHLGMSIKECFRVLKRNELLAIVGDKDYTSGGISVKFFGKDALLPKGPAALSIKTGAPIVFSLLTREKGDRFRLIFGKPIKYKPVGDIESDTKELMGEYIRIFEKYIRQNPDQWYVFRKIWAQN